MFQKLSGEKRKKEEGKGWEALFVGKATLGLAQLVGRTISLTDDTLSCKRKLLVATEISERSEDT